MITYLKSLLESYKKVIIDTISFGMKAGKYVSAFILGVVIFIMLPIVHPLLTVYQNRTEKKMLLKMKERRSEVMDRLFENTQKL